MRALLLAVLAVAILAPAQTGRTFAGVITDDQCATGDHSRMRMGPNDAECTLACVRSHDAFFVLTDGKDFYNLSDQKTPEKFAGRKVTVTGVLDAKTKTIRVESITAAK
jgi:hypothetical protein